MKNLKKHKSPDRIRDPKRIEKDPMTVKKKKLNPRNGNRPKYRHHFLNEEE